MGGIKRIPQLIQVYGLLTFNLSYIFWKNSFRIICKLLLTTNSMENSREATYRADQILRPPCKEPQISLQQ
jgi:hypothetical protein